MATTRVRRDCHGLYVLTNGQVYRPQKAELVNLRRYHLENGYTTRFTEGMEVKVGHITQTAFCRVKTDERTEEWCAHGVYRGKPAKRSEECWVPEKG